MKEIVLPPRSKKGIESQIENLKWRLKIEKEWVRKTELEIESLMEEYERVDEE